MAFRGPLGIEESGFMGGAWLIATDEAGYGPILGPLVIVATVAKVNEASTRPDWSPHTETKRTSAVAPTSLDGLQIGDSKRVFKRDHGWSQFERSVLSLCHVATHEPPARIGNGWTSFSLSTGGPPDSFRRFWEWVAPRTAHDHARFPWYRHGRVAVPTLGTHDDVAPSARILSDWLNTHEIQLAGIHGVVLETLRYNLILSRLQNKAALLADATLRVIKEVIRALPDGKIFVICDKFGGRNRYAAMIQQFFPDGFVRIECEGDTISQYQTMTEQHQISICFRSKGEEHPAIAISSMVAKYTRELAMMSWNAFWQNELPDLRPTAGYYEDGLRFLQDIESVAARLRMPQHWIRRAK
jgi:ribonuclease HII